MKFVAESSLYTQQAQRNAIKASIQIINVTPVGFCFSFYLTSSYSLCSLSFMFSLPSVPLDQCSLFLQLSSCFTLKVSVSGVLLCFNSSPVFDNIICILAFAEYFSSPHLIGKWRQVGKKQCVQIFIHMCFSHVYKQSFPLSLSQCMLIYQDFFHPCTPVTLDFFCFAFISLHFHLEFYLAVCVPDPAFRILCMFCDKMSNKLNSNHV